MENRARKDIEEKILADAEKQLEGFDFPAHRALVIAGADWNHGVIGLAASRIVEKYHYPTILLAEHEGVLTGSCRSIPGVDIHKALTAVSSHLTKFGGHKQAAGLTLDADRLDAFRADLDAWLAENIPPACYIPDEEYDMAVHFDQLTEAFVAGLEALQPTGFGNPAPVLRSSPFVYSAQAIGANGAHLRLSVAEYGVQKSGIFFRAGHLADKLPQTIDILFTPKLNTWMGRTSVQLELKSINPGDVLSEIASKIEDEDVIQHEFLTQMLYNRKINSDTIPGKFILQQELREMLSASPQGTLLLTADLAQTAQLLRMADDAAPDAFIGEMPQDGRAFNAVACYAAGEIPKQYRRIVLAGAPDWYEIPAGAEVFRMEAKSCCREILPDVDMLRESYKTAKAVRKCGERWEGIDMLAHLFEVYGRTDYGCATACMMALHDLDLIRLDLSVEPVGFVIPPMRKIDPDQSAVWRAVQAWRNGG